jgi:predicted amidophosphoribosyltransferase
MFCANCGNALENESTFCNKCGTKAGEAGRKDSAPRQAPPPPSALPPTPNTTQIIIKENKSSLGFLWVIVLFLIGGAVFFFADDLGLTQSCVTPLCRNNAQPFRDFCANCRNNIDTANSVFDAIKGFFD